jgi:hypothetical protein
MNSFATFSLPSPTTIRNHFSYIYVISLFTFLLQIPTFFGEDIVNARDNYLSGLRLDFWGGTSTLVYGHFPSFGVRWQVGLALVQISMTTLGLIIMLGSSSRITQNKGLNFISVYSALMFSSQMTRDGLMFSLLVLGLALLIASVGEKLSLNLFCCSLVFIVFSLSFRPWVSTAVLPILFMILRKTRIKKFKLFAAALAITVLVLPVLNEVVISKSMSLKKSYPEQMVMLMDVATSYCYSNNYETAKNSKIALDLFSEGEAISSNACNLYRPDTWISLSNPQTVSAAGAETDFLLIQPSDWKKFEKLRSIWVDIIISDPVTYLQNRILFAGKLVVGSDSRGFSFFAAESTTEKISSVFRMLYEIGITFHFYSVAAVYIFLLCFPIVRYRRAVYSGVTLDELTFTLLASMLIWIILSSIAYVGSNGRYTYSITLLCLILFARHHNSKTSPTNGSRK